jgi:hypothetical protein
MMDINPSRLDEQQTGERPLNLSDFAQRNQITEDRVWELIEEGELAARFVNDEILILRELDTVGEPQIDLQEAPPITIDHASEFSPNPPETIMVETLRPTEATKQPTFTEEPHMVPPAGIEQGKAQEEFDVHPHIDMFAEQEASASDDNNLPTDDYRDLLVFAQDAMNRTMDLSRQLLATKDELIRMKDERIQQLQAEQQRNEQEIRRLRKKVEDLETLCRLTPNP